MKKITILLPLALYKGLVKLAKANHRSMQGQVVTLIEEAVKKFISEAKAELKIQ